MVSIVNSTTAGEQSGPVTVATGDGGYFVAWYDNAFADPAGRVRGQFYDAAGAKVGGELAIGTSPVNGNSWIEVPPLSAVALADGKVVVSWQSEEGTAGIGASGTDIVQSIVTSNGVTTSAGPQSVVNTTTAGNQSPPVMTATSDGGYFTAWYGNDSSTFGGQGNVFGQYYDANGVKIGGQLNIGTALVNEDSWSSVAPVTVTALPDGKVIVGWQTENSGPSSDGSGTGIAQVITSSNGTVTSAGPQSFMNTVTAGNQSPPQIVATPDGGYFATWWNNDSATVNGQGVLRGQYFDANGAKIGPETQLTTWQVNEDVLTNVPFVDVVVLTGGSIVVGFQTENGAGGPTSTTEVGYVMVSRAGTEVSVTPQALMNTSQAGHQSPPVLTALPSGGFFAAWYDNALSDPGGVVRGQYFDASGARLGTELNLGNRVETWQNGEMPEISVVALADDRVAINWMTEAADAVDGSFTAVVTHLTASPFVDGTAANDVIGLGFTDDDGQFVSQGADTIYGYGGNDLIDGSGGNDIIFGGDGDDTMFGAYGSNTLDGGAGSDMVSFAPHANYVNVDLSTGVAAHTFVSTGTVAAIVNTTTTGEQSGPVSVQTSDGGVFIAWYDNALLDPAGRVRGQFYDAAGAKVGGQLTIGTSPVNGNSWIEVPPLSAVALADGKVVVSWQSEEGTAGIGASGTDIVQSIVTSNGVTTSAGPQSVVNTTTAGNQSPPVMTATSDGGYFTAWYGNDSSTFGGQGNVFGQYFDANGVKIGGQLNIGTALVNEDSWSSVAPVTVTALSDGKVVVGWQTENSGPSSDGSGTGIAQVITSSNGTVTSAGPQSFMNTVTAGDQSPPQIVATPDGGYFATWWNNDSAPVNGQGVLRGQYFDANGAKIGPETQLTTWQVNEDPTNQPYVDVAVLTNGTIVVGFQTENGVNGPTSTTEVGYVMVSRAGTEVSVTPQALMNTNQVGNQSAPVVVALEGGGFFAAWYDNALSNPGGVVRGQYFDVNGARIGTELTFGAGNTASTETDSLGEMPPLTVVALAGNNVAVSWVTDGSSSTDGSGSAVVTARASLTNTNSDTLISIENITGSAFGDVITGNGDNNAIFGGGGNDTITAGAGADTISGGGGNDLIHLGADGTADVIIVSNGHGRDTITGLDAPVANGDGTFTGIDKLDVSSLNDSQGFPVNVADVVVTANHNGDAVLTFPNGEAVTFPGVDPTTASNWAWLEAIGIPPIGPVDGTLGNDVITPTSGAGGTPYTDAQGDSIDTADGLNDTVFGYGGNDLVQSGLGDDLVYGGTGRDTLEGGIGNDTLSGDAGDDLIIGGTFMPQTNVLTNGTFEGGTHGTGQGGTLATWDSWNTATPDLVRNGVSEWFGIGRINPTDGQQYVGLANTNQFPNYQEGLFQNLGTPLVAGHTYTLSFDAAGLQDLMRTNNNYSAPGTASFQVWGSATNGVPGSTDNAPAGWTLLGEVIVSGDTMTNYSISFAPGFQVQSIAIAIGTFSGDNAYITVDRVSLLPAPVNDAEASGNDVLLGGDGSDTLYGTGGNDTLHGGTGNDALFGGHDRDLFVIEDGFGLDTIYGGAGGDDFDTLDASALTENASLTFSAQEAGTLTSAGNTATFADIENIILGAGNDTVNAVNAALGIAIDTGAGNDTVNAGAGNDSVAGGAGDDSLIGGAGDDSLSGGDGADTVEGGTGDDTITGGAGDDSLGGGDGADTVDGGMGDDAIAGGAGDDSLLGGDGHDTVFGDAGNDTLLGDAGDDHLFGGAGNDSLDGGLGNDSLIGGDGADSLSGGLGSDTLNGGLGNDTLDGGDGDDRIIVGAGDVAYGGSGDDVFTVDPTQVGTADITIFGGETGEDLTDPTNGGAGDVLDLRGLSNVTVTYGGGNNEAGTAVYQNTSGQMVTITFAQIETVLVDQGDVVNGTVGSDTMGPGFTDADGDRIDGADGLSSDTISAGAGNDVVDAGFGNDTVFGGIGNDSLFGNVGNDSLLGDAGDDTVLGGTGDDTLEGGDGNDSLDGGVGNDVLDGGSGTDTLIGGDGDDTLYGGAQDDSLLGAAGDDVIYGGLGSDTLLGGAGNDTLYGGDGDDALAVGGSDVAYGGGGDDVFTVDASDPAANINVTIVGGETGEDLTDPTHGGAGDVLDLSNQSNDLTVDVSATPETGTVNGLDADSDADITFAEIEIIRTGAGNDTVNGAVATGPVHVDTGAGMDVITTGAGDDSIFSGDGRDSISSGGGNDTIYAGQDFDTVDGGAGDDLIYGGAGFDSLFGGTGNDIIWGEDGADTLYGGAGDDSLYGGTGDDLIDAGEGADSVDAGSGNDTLYGGLGNDTILAGSGSDLIDGGAGDDSILGGFGNDVLAGAAGNDTLTGDEGNDSLTGGAGDDVLDGGIGNDTLYGGAGNDTAYGGDGDDFINTRTTVGTASPDIGLTHPTNPALSYPSDATPDDDRDLVYGGAGNDTILSGDDRDTVYGGLGNDSIDAGFDDDHVEGGDGDDTLAGNEGRDTIFGGAGDDIISGGVSQSDPTFAQSLAYDLLDEGGFDPAPNNNTDLLYGGDGNDVIYGGDDADTVYGGADNDTLYGGIDDDLIFGDAGHDHLLGEQGNDTLFGGLGNDTLDGGAGDDLIIIGAGDVAFGGGGDDTFRIDPSLSGAAAITLVGGTTDQDGAGDVLDLTGGRKVKLVYDQTDPTWNGTTSESGTASYLNAADETVTINFSEIDSVIVCFARGTMIETAEGERAIETLQAGDLVRTIDHAFQPIRWIGSKTVAAEGLVAPILIKAGALGNTRDLRVSPQHRMLLGGWEAEMLFGEPEVLMAAKHLVNDSTIVRVTGGEVEYFHMLFDCHELVFSNGIPSESFHPGLEGWGALAEAARAEILHLFPQLAQDRFANYGQSARLSLKAHEAKVLAAYHDSKDIPLPALRKHG